MNRNYLSQSLILLAVCILLLAISWMTVNQREEYKLERDLIRKEAIERGYAHYNPTNAIWEWKNYIFLQK